MSELTEILKQFLDEIANDIRNNIPSKSGESAKSIETNVKENPNGSVSGEITGSKYIWTLEDGRGPTKNGNSGGKTLRESILDWIKQSNFQFPMPPKYSWSKPIKNAEQLSWAIAITIHREGNKLFRSGGKSGVITNALTEQRLDAFEKVFAGKAGKIMLGELSKRIKNT